MKNAIFVLALACTLSVSAQTQLKTVAVPAAVAKAFSTEFPDTQPVWEKEDGNFEAEFTLNGQKSSVLYDHNGRRKSLESSIQQSELPAPAIEYLAKTYPVYKVRNTTKAKDDQNMVTYEAEITGKDGMFDVIFDQKGILLKVVKADNK